MRKMLDNYQNHMGWDNEEAIEILLDYIDSTHLEWGKHNEDKHLQDYLDYAVREDIRVASRTSYNIYVEAMKSMGMDYKTFNEWLDS